MARTKAQKSPIVEEIQFKSDSAFLCLLLNRRSRFIRVIDFRAGALPAKRLFIQSVAKREQVHKIITLVEKDEVSSWTKVGFVREGTIPGFYKRSDGHLCGCVVGQKGKTVEVSDDSVKLTERTINAAKKIIRDIPEEIRGSSVQEAEAEDATDARDQAWKKGIALGGFDPFGRGAERIFFEASFRKTKPNFLSAEFQDCFGHSLIEILRSPEDDAELLGAVAGIRAVSETLHERGIVSAFGFAPNDNVALASAYLAAGFRKTGLLASGIQLGEERKDAIMWTRKLANPSGEDEV